MTTTLMSLNTHHLIFIFLLPEIITFGINAVQGYKFCLWLMHSKALDLCLKCHGIALPKW